MPIHLFTRRKFLTFAALAPYAGSVDVAGMPDIAEANRWRADLRFMASEMMRLHKNLFHTVSRAEFEAAVRLLDDKILLLGPHQIMVEMAKIAAMVGDGHTSISPTRDPRIGFRTYPIKCYFFEDGVFVRSATKANTNLIGGRVIAIDESPFEAVYAKVRGIIGRDNEMGARFFAPHLLCMPEVLHALGIANDVDRATFTLEFSGKRVRPMLAPHGPARMMRPDTDASWLPEDGWLDAREAGGVSALWLSDPAKIFLDGTPRQSESALCTGQ